MPYFFFTIFKLFSSKLRIKDFEAAHGVICADIPNFRTCTAIPAKKVNVRYDIDEKTFDIFPASVSNLLNQSDMDFIRDVFMSKFAPVFCVYRYLWQG